MQVFVIVAHPNAGSFNHAIAHAAVSALQRNGHEAIFRDLYAEKFDPILPAGELSTEASLPPEVELHCQQVTRADGIIIVHPNWWGQPPAILKGWVDRVLRPGRAYDFVAGDNGEGKPVGLLKASAALVFNTSNTPADLEEQIYGDPLETLWKKCVFALCGVPTVYRETFAVVITSTLEQRRAWLEKVRAVVGGYFSGEKSATHQKQRRLIQVGDCIYDAEQFPHSHGFESLDPVGREAFVNHIHVSGDDRDQVADQIVRDWKAIMLSDWPDQTFRIYRHKIDDEIILRFHSVRPGVANWYDGDEGLIIVKGSDGIQAQNRA